MKLKIFQNAAACFLTINRWIIFYHPAERID